MPAVTIHFSCQACGNSFPSTKEQMAIQPVCPKCRSYGKILGPDGRPLAAQRSGQGASPYAAARGGARGGPPPRPSDNDVVEIDYTVAHGKADKTKALKMAFVVGGAAVLLVFVFILVKNLQANMEAKQKEQEDTVLNVKDYDDAINKAHTRIEAALKGGGKCNYTASEDVSEALDAIAASGGGVKPTWKNPPKPGSPHRSYSYVVKATFERYGQKVENVGFVVFLYYKNLNEVDAAYNELKNQIKGSSYGLTYNNKMWFICYSGVNLAGPVLDAINNAKSTGAPNDFKQFRQRTGAAGDDY